MHGLLRMNLCWWMIKHTECTMLHCETLHAVRESWRSRWCIHMGLEVDLTDSSSEPRGAQRLKVGCTPSTAGHFGEKSGRIPDTTRKHSQSKSWNFHFQYGWKSPSPVRQGRFAFQKNTSRIALLSVRLAPFLVPRFAVPLNICEKGVFEPSKAKRLTSAIYDPPTLLRALLVGDAPEQLKSRYV